MSRPVAPLVFATALAVHMVATAQAHHSISNVYDFRERVTLDAVVAQFEFVNPHPFVTVDVKESGKEGRWRLEMDNRHELAALGFETGTLKPGDRIVVIVNPGRTQKRSAYVRRLERPADGFTYQHHD
jgi:hypothetical protein